MSRAVGVQPNTQPATVWREALIVDLALGISHDAILQEYNLQSHQLDAVLADPAFMAQVEALSVDLKKSGVTFEMKARIQADYMLDTVWGMVHDERTPANVRADLIKSMVRWAGHEKQAGDQPNGGRSGFSISINLTNPSANGPQPIVIEGERV